MVDTVLSEEEESSAPPEPEGEGEGEAVKPLTNVQVGTLGGTLCSIWPSISLGDIMRTVIMAALGAVTSYLVSRLLDPSSTTVNDIVL